MQEPVPFAPAPSQEPLDLGALGNAEIPAQAPAAPKRDELLLDASRLVDEDEAPAAARRRQIVPEAPQPAPAPRSAGTLFERMANLSARRRDDNEDGGDEGGSINIPRFLGRQNNQ